jgi:hypothetical protein
MADPLARMGSSRPKAPSATVSSGSHSPDAAGRARTVGTAGGGGIVDSSDEYRVKAMELLMQVGRARDDATRDQLLNMAVSYARLADRDERAGNCSAPETR